MPSPCITMALSARPRVLERGRHSRPSVDSIPFHSPDIIVYESNTGRASDSLVITDKHSSSSIVFAVVLTSARTMADCGHTPAGWLFGQLFKHPPKRRQ